MHINNNFEWRRGCCLLVIKKLIIHGLSILLILPTYLYIIQPSRTFSNTGDFDEIQKRSNWAEQFNRFSEKTLMVVCRTLQYCYDVQSWSPSFGLPWWNSFTKPPTDLTSKIVLENYASPRVTVFRRWTRNDDACYWDQNYILLITHRYCRFLKILS